MMLTLPFPNKCVGSGAVCKLVINHIANAQAAHIPLSLDAVGYKYLTSGFSLKRVHL